MTRIRLRDVVRGAVRSLPRAPAAASAAWVAVRGNKRDPVSIGSFLERNAGQIGPGVAIRFEDQVVSHLDLDRRVNRTARALAAAGVCRGDAIALMMENRPEVLIVVGALAKLGAVPALLNTNQRARSLCHSITVANCSRAIVGAECWDAFCEVRSEAGLRDHDRVWWVDDAPQSCGSDPTFEHPEFAEPPANTLDLGVDSRAMSAASVPWTAAVRIGDPCFFIFTSGTTGLPKASIMTHMRWVKAGHGFGRGMLNLGLDDTIYAPLPLYHNMALTIGWASAAVTGAAFAFRRRFSASEFWSDCRKHFATAMVYIGEVPRYLLNQPPALGDQNHDVKKAVGVGLRADVWPSFKERFGVREVYETYAASEANTLFLNVLNLDQTVGVCPTPHKIVRYDIERDEPVRGPDGRLIPVGSGEVGLLLGKVTPRFDFDGYTDAEASERKLFRDAFVDGDVWFNSGDLLRKIGWGHAEFVDRIGDTFRWKSENVATSEVEQTINQHPQVLESTAYGVEIPGTEGRAGMIAISASCAADEFDLEELSKRCGDELPAYAVPVFVRLQKDLDTTGTFKHQKTRLREEAWATSDPVFVLLPRSARYQRLTPELASQLVGQRW